MTPLLIQLLCEQNAHHEFQRDGITSCSNCPAWLHIPLSFTDTSLLRTPLFYGHLSFTDTSLLRTPLFYGHISFTDTFLLRTPFFYGHLSFTDTFLLGTPFFYGHLSFTDISLYGHLYGGRKRGLVYLTFFITCALWYTRNLYTNSLVHIENVFRSVPVAITVVERGKRSHQSATVSSDTSALNKTSKFIKE